MNYNDTERLYKSGKMPRWAYYQLNGKTAQDNYIEQKQSKQKSLSPAAAIDKEQAEKALKEAINEVLNDLLKGLKTD